MDIKEFAEKYIKAWQEALLEGKINTFEALIDHDSVFHVRDSDFGGEGYRQHIVDVRKYSQTIQIDIKYLTGEVNLFAVDFSRRFKLTGEIPGLPVSIGKVLTSHYLCLLHVRNDKVIESWANGAYTVSDK